ncbi:MAG: hypothetical protein LBH01_10780 [Verrucomicrobiales bacterium]|jgi:hypothetical protein|nr:hypothetical protein [Verrucomicrobiales bacterium]
MKIRLHSLIPALTAFFAISADLLAQQEPMNEIPTAPVAVDHGHTGAAVDPSHPIALQIISPRNNEIIDSPPVDIFFDLKNYELSENGNALRVIINNQPPLTLYSTTRPLTLNSIHDGGQTIRAFVVRPDGTMIREAGIAITHFFVRKKDFQNFVDQNKPYLTVNLPSGDSYDTDINGQLCVDVLLNNPVQAANYKIHYSMEGYEGFLNGKEVAYWPNVAIGKHKLLVELLDTNGRPVLGPFNRVERYFEIRQLLKAAPMPGDTTPAPATSSQPD